MKKSCSNQSRTNSTRSRQKTKETVPEKSENQQYKDIFISACNTGDGSHLESLITQSKFDINQPLEIRRRTRLPIFFAVEKQSIPITTLLLDHGANPSSHKLNRWSVLTVAIRLEQVDLVRLLIERGSNLMLYKFEAMHHALDVLQPGKSTEILKILMDRISSSRRIYKKFKKTAQLCKAILQNDEDKVTNMLKADDYESYAETLGVEYRPARLALKLVSMNMLKIFIDARVEIEHIYLTAVRKGYLSLVKLCVDICSNVWISVMLYEACRYNQLNVIKFLMNKYDLDLDGQGWAPMFDVKEPGLLRALLTIFPGTKVSLKANSKDTLLSYKSKDCEQYALLLEHGADPRFGDCKNIHKHSCGSGGRAKAKCQVQRYLGKMQLIAPEYVKRIKKRIGINDYSCQSQDKVEVAKMLSMQISPGTTFMPVRNLYDFLFFEPNMAARYSRNEVIQNIYVAHEKNFQKFLPGYGFGLNYQFRKGEIRRERLDLALELLCLAFGTGLPEGFDELIFGYFSNGTLKRFNVKLTSS